MGTPKSKKKSWKGLRAAIDLAAIEQIKTALVLNNNNVTLAAKSLDIDRVTLHRQLVRYNLQDWSPADDPEFTARCLAEQAGLRLSQVVPQ